MYAVFKTGGKQYRVSQGDTLLVEKIEGEKGSTVSFSEVLLVSGDGALKIGSPYVSGAKISAQILNHDKGPKVTIFKQKRRKGFRKKTGHRQPLVSLRITEISV